MNPTEIDFLIKKWNPHFEDSSKGEWVGKIPREKYMQRLWKMMDIRHILILTGVRKLWEINANAPTHGEIDRNRY